MKGMSVWAKVIVLMVVLVMGNGGAVGQEMPEADAGAAGLYFALKKLPRTERVLHVIAHPDDEDGGMLTALSRGEGVGVSLFSITRGEGGANLVSDDFFDRLGLLRTLEHQHAARYYGIRLFYSHAVDYGYSKTLEEANRAWKNGDPILGDLVRVVRETRPHVIAARFRGDANDGHGHHQMAGVLAARAFEAAGDAGQFPEQIAAGLRPWQPVKLYHDNIIPQWRPADAKLATLSVQTGTFDPLLGRSYAQVARMGLGFQKSQGMAGFVGNAGKSESHYRLKSHVLGDDYRPEKERTFFDQMATGMSNWKTMAGEGASQALVKSLEEIFSAAEEAVREFRPAEMERVVPALERGHAATQRALALLMLEKVEGEAMRRRDYLIADLEEKRDQFEEAMVRALAIDFSVTAYAPGKGRAPSFFGPGSSGIEWVCADQEIELKYQLTNRSRLPVIVESLNWVRADEDWVSPSTEGEKLGKMVGYNESVEGIVVGETSTGLRPTRPYWQRKSIRESFYEISERPKSGSPVPEPLISLEARVRVGGESFSIVRPVMVKVEDAELGPSSVPLMAVPAISVRMKNETAVITKGDAIVNVKVEVRSHRSDPGPVTVRLELPEKWSEEKNEPKELQFRQAGEKKELTFRAFSHLATTAFMEDNNREDFRIRAFAKLGDRDFSEGFVTVKGKDIGRLNYFRPAEMNVRSVGFRYPKNAKLGYVMGSGDGVPDCLEQLGLGCRMLGGEDLASGDLSAFDAVIIGVRAYAVRGDLVANNGRLLEYVKNGGVLLVQYQTPEFDKNYGPYPYKMGGNPEEVSEEDAAVTILEPKHPLMTSPNPITAADFEGWVEQRGSKFLQSWDEQYVPLLECHDQGQAAQKGGMVAAKYGKGVYVYSAYAWYRQLPEGVPGAMRIFANQISAKWTMGVEAERGFEDSQK